MAQQIKFPLAVAVCARCRPRDGQLLCSRPMRYRGEGGTFPGWTANDAKLSLGEQQRCSRELSTAIVEQLEARGLVPHDRAPQPTFAKH